MAEIPASDAENDIEIDPSVDQSPELSELSGLSESIRMLEVDSYDRLIEGLKSASDGARNLSPRLQDEMWDVLADLLDKVRVAIARDGGLNRPSDTDRTARKRGSSAALSAIEAYTRVYDGLHAASGAARQLATGHRMDVRWSVYAMHLEKLRDQSSEMVRRKSAENKNRAFLAALEAKGLPH